MMSNQNNKYIHIGIAALSFFILFMGFGRVLNFVTHDPVLAYANSYDMIPLQACHQIWPAGAGIDIRKGTPEAPLRAYTLSKHVDTPCAPSSELIFTGVAIKIAIWKNTFTGEKLVSIKSVGFIKAAFLIVTALLMQIFFTRRFGFLAQILHAAVVCFVLADPIVTLYFNTFYSQFSAVYFLYASICCMALLGVQDKKYQLYEVIFLGLSLMGLGTSMQQYNYLALVFGGIIAGYYCFKKMLPVSVAVIIFTVAAYLLSTSGFMSFKNKNLEYANKMHVIGTFIELSPDAEEAARVMGFSRECFQLSQKKPYDFDTISMTICGKIVDVNRMSYAKLIILQPSIVVRMIGRGVSMLKSWNISYYGQVEGEVNSSVSKYQNTIYEFVGSASSALYMFYMFSPLCFLIFYYLLSISVKIKFKQEILLLTFTLFLQWYCYFSVVLMFGFHDFIRNCHLVTVAAMFNFLAMAILLLMPVLKMSGYRENEPN